jgi:pimeloyl-ACP methyl ester carboxylesterase
MAARHPDLVQRLILQSAVGPLPYPDRRTRLAAYLGFSGRTERVTWRAISAMMRVAPAASLRLWLGQPSTLPARQVVAALSPEDRAGVRGLVLSMRSGHGFRNDLRAAPDLTADVIQPTLLIATRHDGGVPFAHAQALAAAIRPAELVESQAGSHLIWLGPDWPTIAARVRAFLTAGPITDPTAAPEADR